jgi:hypothetical protein
MLYVFVITPLTVTSTVPAATTLLIALTSIFLKLLKVLGMGGFHRFPASRFNYLCTYDLIFWMRAYPLRGEVGGVGPEILEFTGPQMALAYQLDVISQGPKNSQILRPNPLPLSFITDMHASKSLCTGLYKS